MVTKITNHTRADGPSDKIFSTVDVIVGDIPTIRFWFVHKSSAKQAADSLAKACSMGYAPEAYHKAAGSVHNNIPDITKMKVDDGSLHRISWDGYTIPSQCGDKECGKCDLADEQRKEIGCTVPTKDEQE